MNTYEKRKGSVEKIGRKINNSGWKTDYLLMEGLEEGLLMVEVNVLPPNRGAQLLLRGAVPLLKPKGVKAPE